MSGAPPAEGSGPQDTQRLREVPGRIRRGQVKIRGAVHQGQDGKATGGLPRALPGLITAMAEASFLLNVWERGGGLCIDP